MPIKLIVSLILFFATQSYILPLFVFRRASDNDFTGQIPDYIGSWSNLEEMQDFFSLTFTICSYFLTRNSKHNLYMLLQFFIN